jgi:hypothetical protein
MKDYETRIRHIAQPKFKQLTTDKYVTKVHRTERQVRLSKVTDELASRWAAPT